jgi:hypothetical protein
MQEIILVSIWERKRRGRYQQPAPLVGGLLVARSRSSIILSHMYIGANYIKPFQKRSDQIQQIKATLRYNAHRPTLEGAKGARQLFGWDGELDKNQAYEMIDEAERGTRYWRFKISPDPKTENPEKNVDLREVTTRIMQELQERKGKLEFIAVVHDDHSPIDHIHAIVIFKERMEAKDYAVLRQVGREACLSQQQGREQIQEFLKQLQQVQYRLNTRTIEHTQPPIGMAGGRARRVRKAKEPTLPCPQGGMHSMIRLKTGKWWCPTHKRVQEQSAGLSL